MTLKAREPNLGKQIRAARLRRRLSQGVVSRRSGIHPSYLSRIEHGKIRPTLATVRRIADALRMPIGDLLALKPGKEKEGPCPISATGQCLLDLLDTGPLPGPNKPIERYSLRQLRMLQQLALLLHEGDKRTLDAIEVLLRGLLGEDYVKKEFE
jgi:transcriptional regulator with XRE-family HTH domain